jgi:quinohemoprotein ethanol dehydrogenase
MSRRILNRVAVCLAVVSMIACAATPAAAQSAVDWLGHNGDADAANYSSLGRITPSTVSRLGLAWALALPGEASLEATPVEADGVIYFTGSYGAVYAVDVPTGRLLWKYDPQTWKYAPWKLRLNFAVNRGPAYDHGRIFSAALDGRLFALDARTGHLLWSVQTVPIDGRQFITGAPVTFRGKVIIGSGGADLDTRGYVTAYDQATGRQIWRFYTVPGSPAQNKGDPVMQRAAATWHGPFWKLGGGGGDWDSITFDPALNRIYLGIANAGPENGDERSPGGGDNLFTASIVALDADTGKYIWHYQLVPDDVWDYDCTQQMVLADLKIGGKSRKVLMQAPKNGFFYVLDRETGQLLSAAKIVKVTWASSIDLKTGRPVEVPGQRYETGSAELWPSASGAHSWQAMSFNAITGLVYIPTMHEGERLTHGPAGSGEVEIGGIAIGTIAPPPSAPKATLLAWNPVTQTPAWKVDQALMWNGGTLSTGGNLVFQGTADGYFSAYDASTGKLLWHVYVGQGIIAPPITYEVSGRQYVSVLVGFGASAGIDSADMGAGWSFAAPRRLLTFTLDGKAVLPPSPTRFAKLQLLDNPALKLDPAKVAAGHEMFLACALCHGKDAVGAGGPAPDLRASPIALNPDSLWTVLHGGALLPAGMPSFPDLTRDQMTDIFDYIRARARAGLAGDAAPR